MAIPPEAELQIKRSGRVFGRQGGITPRLRNRGQELGSRGEPALDQASEGLLELGWYDTLPFPHVAWEQIIQIIVGAAIHVAELFSFLI